MQTQIRVGFLVVRLFPMYVLVLAADALRLANKYAVARRFDWVLISDEGRPVEASNGIHMDCDAAVHGSDELDYAFVLAGDDQTQAITRRIRRWLLHISRSNTVLGAIDSGVFLLAACRVLRRRPIAVHPGAAFAFREEYPDIPIHDGPVVEDSKLLTCAGGLSVVMLMLSIIKKHCGEAVAQAVAEDMVINGSTGANQPQGCPGGSGKHASSHDDVVDLMERHIEEPLSLQALSDRVGRSRRQVTRQFVENIGRSPMSFYRTLRLNRAKQLLFQSDLSISQIAAASGFQSLSSFSRCFSAEFECSPRTLLLNLRSDGNASAVPFTNRHKRLSLRRTV
jgi:transcriptional regulator GlxA family with amidase domain